MPVTDFEYRRFTRVVFVRPIYGQTWRHRQQRKHITYRSADSGGTRHGREQHARVTFGEVWAFCLWDGRALKQTNGQTDALIAILRSPIPRADWISHRNPLVAPTVAIVVQLINTPFMLQQCVWPHRQAYTLTSSLWSLCISLILSISARVRATMTHTFSHCLKAGRLFTRWRISSVNRRPAVY